MRYHVVKPFLVAHRVINSFVKGLTRRKDSWSHPLMELDNDMQQMREELDARRREEETPWLDMSADDIAAFLKWHPTYMMTPRQASDWWAGVESGIRATQSRGGFYAGQADTSGWLYGAGDRPSERFAPKDNEEKR